MSAINLTETRDADLVKMPALNISHILTDYKYPEFLFKILSETLRNSTNTAPENVTTLIYRVPVRSEAVGLPCSRPILKATKGERVCGKAVGWAENNFLQDVSFRYPNVTMIQVRFVQTWNHPKTADIEFLACRVNITYVKQTLDPNSIYFTSTVDHQIYIYAGDEEMDELKSRVVQLESSNQELSAEVDQLRGEVSKYKNSVPLVVHQTALRKLEQQLKSGFRAQRQDLLGQIHRLQHENRDLKHSMGFARSPRII